MYLFSLKLLKSLVWTVSIYCDIRHQMLLLNLISRRLICLSVRPQNSQNRSYIFNTVDSLYLDYPLSRTKCSAPWNFPQQHYIDFFYFEPLYLKLFPILNKFSGPLNHFLSLSQAFPYSNFIFQFPNKLEFESKQKFQL